MRSPSKNPPKWRASLDGDDIDVIVAWAEKWNLERIAQILAELGQSDASAAPLAEWRIVALLQVARRHVESPNHPLDLVARDVAQATIQPRIRTIPIDKLAGELERRLSSKRLVLALLSRSRFRAAIIDILDGHGVRRVAKIVAALMKPDGQRGRVGYSDTVLLQEIAHAKRAEPMRNFREIVIGLTKNAPQVQNRNIGSDSFLRELRRGFSDTRHIWRLRSNKTLPLSEVARDRALRRILSIGARRVASRILGLMPSAIDVYDSMLKERRVDECGNDGLRQTRTKQIKWAGRERIENWFCNAIERLTGPKQEGAREVRSFFDVIEPDLQQFFEEKSQKGRREG